LDTASLDSICSIVRSIETQRKNEQRESQGARERWEEADGRWKTFFFRSAVAIHEQIERLYSASALGARRAQELFCTALLCFYRFFSPAASSAPFALSSQFFLWFLLLVV
jgi:hypothetical protein